MTELAKMTIQDIFRKFDMLPHFELRDAGRVSDPAADDDFASDAPRFWREYCLSASGVECIIHEDLRNDLFELSPPPLAHAADAPEERAPSFGDIMTAHTTFESLPPGFTPLQVRALLPPPRRLLLTAAALFPAPVRSE